MVALAMVRRGEIYWVDFDPTVGSEPRKVRPALVVQNDIGNQFSSTTIVAVITSGIPKREFPFIAFLPDGLLEKPSVVNCAQVRVVSLRRLVGQRLAECDAKTMRAVDEALRVSLGLS